MISVHLKKLRKRVEVSPDEERAIRKDPVGQSSAIIKKVFGAAR